MSDNNNDTLIRDTPGEYRLLSGTLRELNSILQRDATDTTYKYALLRGLVEISGQFHVDPLDGEWVSFPMGLLVEKWLYYYYPFVENNVPQRNGERIRREGRNQLAFRSHFKIITDHYDGNGGLGFFARDLKTSRIPAELNARFRRLIKKVRDTIVNMPMRYLGRSIDGSEYRVARCIPGSAGRLQGSVTRDVLIYGLGTGQLRREYYELFRAVGGFATGWEAIFGQWVQFTHRVAKVEGVPSAEATEALFASADETHSTQMGKRVYECLLDRPGGLRCVWSETAIRRHNNWAVDHVIPHSVWGNNSYWNLMPTTGAINGRKSDRIPAPELIERRRGLIAGYWQCFHEHSPSAFELDFGLSLTGRNTKFDDGSWVDLGLASLKEKCSYLIERRGFPAWTL
jgi:hypothetical protein